MSSDWLDETFLLLTKTGSILSIAFMGLIGRITIGTTPIKTVQTRSFFFFVEVILHLISLYFLLKGRYGDFTDNTFAGFVAVYQYYCRSNQCKTKTVKQVQLNF